MPILTVTIDAGVLGVPREKGIADAARRYVSTLLDWARLLDEAWVAIRMSERASEALMDDGLYPLRDALRTMFGSHGIVEYDVNTVAQVVERVLQLTPCFEATFRIRDVLYENITTTPDVLRLESAPRLHSDLARCIVLIAILRKHCRDAIRDHYLILRDAPNRTVDVRAIVHEVEHERADLSALPLPPEYFEGDVLVCDDFRGLLECIDESAVLRSAIDDVAVVIACRIALFKSRTMRFLEPEWEDTEGIRMGPAFCAQIRRCCRGTPESFPKRVLRAIAETLNRQNMGAVHVEPLRVAAPHSG